MSFLLPPSDHPARELFDVAQFAHDAAPERRYRAFPFFGPCANALRRYVRKTDAVGAAGICWRDETFSSLVLLSCDENGNVREVWEFSK